MTIDPALNADAKKLEFPPRIFLYTLDQVAFCIDVDIIRLKRSYIFFHGRSTGVAPRRLIMARNISGPAEKPSWRVAENELVRWMKHKGFVFSMSDRLLK